MFEYYQSKTKGTGDATYDLVSVLYHSLQGAETYEFFESDAEEAGEDPEQQPVAVAVVEQLGQHAARLTVAHIRG